MLRDYTLDTWTSALRNGYSPLGLQPHTNAAQNLGSEITWLLTNHAAPEQVKAILQRLTLNEKGEPRDIHLDEQAFLESIG